jgi:hypothetical protein
MISAKEPDRKMAVRFTAVNPITPIGRAEQRRHRLLPIIVAGRTYAIPPWRQRLSFRAKKDNVELVSYSITVVDADTAELSNTRYPSRVLAIQAPANEAITPDTSRKVAPCRVIGLRAIGKGPEETRANTNEQGNVPVLWRLTQRGFEPENKRFSDPGRQTLIESIRRAVAPQVGLEPTTLRLTAGLETFAGSLGSAIHSSKSGGYARRSLRLELWGLPGSNAAGIKNRGAVFAFGIAILASLGARYFTRSQINVRSSACRRAHQATE